MLHYLKDFLKVTSPAPDDILSELHAPYHLVRAAGMTTNRVQAEGNRTEAMQ